MLRRARDGDVRADIVHRECAAHRADEQQAAPSAAVDEEKQPHERAKELDDPEHACREQ